MNPLRPVPDPAPLEHDLPWLHAQVLTLGRPSYWCSTEGLWQASVHILTPRAVQAEVKGDFNHLTLSAAIENLLGKFR